MPRVPFPGMAAVMQQLAILLSAGVAWNCTNGSREPATSVEDLVTHPKPNLESPADRDLLVAAGREILPEPKVLSPVAPMSRRATLRVARRSPSR